MRREILSKVFTGCVAIVCALVLLGGEAFAADTSAGKITRLTGAVNVIRSGKASPVKVGSRVVQGDLVETQAGSSVKILMADSTLLSLGASSKLRIRAYNHNTQTRQTAANYDLVYGRGRAKVPTRKQTPNNIKFSTPTAVAGVRGTELIIIYDPATGTTQIIAIDGSVSVVGEGVGGEVLLTNGMSTTLGTGSGPSTPVILSPEEIDRIRQEAQTPGSSPRQIMIIEIPGESEEDVTVSVDTSGGAPVVTVILEDTGTVLNPESLIDQEPPPFTPVIIRLNIP